MAIEFNPPKKPLVAFSLAGLADIVLLLLIFFMLTSTFIPQFGIQVELPRTETSTPTERMYVTVVITDDGRFFVEQDQVPREQLLSAISEARGDRTSLVLRADKAATVDQFAHVASIARALDLAVLMATEREDLAPGRR
jgi:biopolymer transport protein ExbD